MSPCRPTRLALGLLAAFAASAHADDLLVQADQLLSQQRHQEAYTLLSPLEDERGGDPNYDFLLGRAALASGHHTEAAFAFERCLAVDPKNGPCRMQMAQAHMVLGETDSARLELKTIQEYNPPAEVQSLVAQYMGMLQVSESKAQNQISTYAQATLGHDTNVNSANDQSQIAIPALGGLYFVKDPSGLEQDDNYAQLEAGVRLRRGLSPAWSLLARRLA
jgi:tetratricopeptide (TPR) repeat protein